MPWSGLGSLHFFSGRGRRNADTRAGGGRPAAGRGPARAQRDSGGGRGTSWWRGREAGRQPAGIAPSPASGRLHDPEPPTLGGPGPELEPGQRGLTGTIVDPPPLRTPAVKAQRSRPPYPAPPTQLLAVPPAVTRGGLTCAGRDPELAAPGRPPSPAEPASSRDRRRSRTAPASQRRPRSSRPPAPRSPLPAARSSPPAQLPRPRLPPLAPPLCSLGERTPPPLRFLSLGVTSAPTRSCSG